LTSLTIDAKIDPVKAEKIKIRKNDKATCSTTSVVIGTGCIDHDHDGPFKVLDRVYKTIYPGLKLYLLLYSSAQSW
jgi:hypothetical protein